MSVFANIFQWMLGALLIFSSLGIILAKKPVYSSLSFLLTLFLLSVFFLQMEAQFISAMQILVYAGAILVIFMFVIVLFQDAHAQISKFESRSPAFFLAAAVGTLLVAFVFLGRRLISLKASNEGLPADYGTVQSLGRVLYLDFFFPFEAVIMLFLIALIGALYIGKKAK